MSTVYQADTSVDLEQNVIWQYANAKAFTALVNAEQDWYSQNVTEFFNFWRDKMLNLDRADDFGLSVWGKILNFKRQILLKDGSVYILSTEAYRLLLKGQFLKMTTNGSISDANRYLQLLFGSQGAAYCLDNYDMTISYIFEFKPTQEQLFLLENVDFLPRPAGVKYEILVLDDQFLGFDESNMQTFDHGILYNRKSLR